MIIQEASGSRQVQGSRINDRQEQRKLNDKCQLHSTHHNTFYQCILHEKKGSFKQITGSAKTETKGVFNLLLFISISPYPS